jgi:Ca-activated chloride channel homolog
MEFGVFGIQILLWAAAWLVLIFLGGTIIWEHKRWKRDGDRFGDLNTVFRLLPDDIWKNDSDVIKARAGNQATRVRLVKHSLRARRNVRYSLLFVGFAALVLAMGRPRWGTKQEDIFKQGIDLVFLVDTSNSMKAEDIPPNRLGKARSEISALLSHLGNNRAGLVGFASTTRLHCPLTLDFRGLKSILENSLSLGPGTNIEAAVGESLRVLRDSKAISKAIILLSDGEGHEGDIEKTINSAKAADVKIFSVGIGTPEGGPIPEIDESGVSGYKKRNGELVWTKLDEETLTRLAKETGGEYFRASNTEVEAADLAQLIYGMEKTKFSQTVTTRKEEQFAIFLLFAAILIAIEAGLGDFQRIAWEADND